MPQYVKVGGTWRQVDETANCGYIKVGGTWRTVTNSYVKVAGTWRNVCAPVVTTTTTTTTTAAPTTTTTTTAAPTTTTTTTAAPTTTTTTAAPPPPDATISNLTYTAISSTTGNLSWTTNGDIVRFTGSATNYPYPYNYGTYTSYTPGVSFPAEWAGRLVNMIQGQSYTVTVDVRYSGGSGNSQTITFTHTAPTTTTTAAPTTTTTTTTTAAPGCTVGGPCGSGYTCYPEGFYTYYSYNAACNCVLENGFC